MITSIHSKHLRCLGPYQSDCAPSILITFINMMLLQYGEDKTTPPVDSCETVFFYSGQQQLQIAFLLIAVISVPVLLFGTPILFCYTHKKKGVVRTKLYFYEIRSCVTYLPQNEPSGSSSNESQSSGDHTSSQSPIASESSSEEHEEETFSDVMIHQVLCWTFFFNTAVLIFRLEGHSYYRVCPGMHFAHCFVSSSVGP